MPQKLKTRKLIIIEGKNFQIYGITSKLLVEKMKVKSQVDCSHPNPCLVHVIICAPNAGALFRRTISNGNTERSGRLGDNYIWRGYATAKGNFRVTNREGE